MIANYGIYAEFGEIIIFDLVAFISDPDGCWVDKSVILKCTLKAMVSKGHHSPIFSSSLMVILCCCTIWNNRILYNKCGYSVYHHISTIPTHCVT